MRSFHRRYSSTMSVTTRPTSGSVRFAWSSVKYFTGTRAPSDSDLKEKGEAGRGSASSRFGFPLSLFPFPVLHSASPLPQPPVRRPVPFFHMAEHLPPPRRPRPHLRGHQDERHGAHPPPP